MPPAATKVLTAHIPLPLAEKVDQMAARLERPRGWIVKQALSAWIDQEDERSRLTREAMDDVDAGRPEVLDGAKLDVEQVADEAVRVGFVFFGVVVVRAGWPLVGISQFYGWLMGFYLITMACDVLEYQRVLRSGSNS